MSVASTFFLRPLPFSSVFFSKKKAENPIPYANIPSPPFSPHAAPTLQLLNAQRHCPLPTSCRHPLPVRLCPCNLSSPLPLPPPRCHHHGGHHRGGELAKEMSPSSLVATAVGKHVACRWVTPRCRYALLPAATDAPALGKDAKVEVIAKC